MLDRGGGCRLQLGALIIAILGQPEEQVLERRELRREREDADARLSECQRQAADVGLLGLEGETVLADCCELDPPLFTRYPKLLPRQPIVNPGASGESAEAKAGDEPAKPSAPAPDPAKEEKKKQEKAAAAQLIFAKDFLNDGRKDKARERLLKIVSEYPDTAAAKEAKDLLAGMKK